MAAGLSISLKIRKELLVAAQFQDWGSSFDNLAAQMRAMLKQMHDRNLFRSQPSQAWLPKINLYETPSCFFACAELAGMKLEDIEVHVVDGELLLRGVRPKPSTPECPVGGEVPFGISVHLMEIDAGEFERRISLPADISVERISAMYRSGYLWVLLPRASASGDQ